MGDIGIRKAVAADREAIGKLWWEMMLFHRECDARAFRLKPEAEAKEIWLRHLAECMEDEKQLVLVADAEGELVGFGMGRLGEDPPCFDLPPHAFVTNFLVSERARRRGIGRRLYEALAQHFRGLGVKEIRLGVAALNPVSNAFWRELGFEPAMVTMRKAL
ncbi:MAG: N-acetyltransferase family protein [Armatimonadota bacterium]